jgi:hypothetical protein
MDMHVSGRPPYVLDPKVQQGRKLPRWQPRSRRGVFMGLSLQHTSEVPQVLNLSTGRITTQFHIVFNEQFTTVSFSERETEPPDHWEELCLENFYQILTDTEISHLHNVWLSPEEQE